MLGLNVHAGSDDSTRHDGSAAPSAPTYKRNCEQPLIEMFSVTVASAGVPSAVAESAAGQPSDVAFALMLLANASATDSTGLPGATPGTLETMMSLNAPAGCEAIRHDQPVPLAEPLSE